MTRTTNDPRDNKVRLNKLFRQLSACEITRLELEEATGKEWW